MTTCKKTNAMNRIFLFTLAAITASFGLTLAASVAQATTIESCNVQEALGSSYDPNHNSNDGFVGGPHYFKKTSAIYTFDASLSDIETQTKLVKGIRIKLSTAANAASGDKLATAVTVRISDLSSGAVATAVTFFSTNQPYDGANMTVSQNFEEHFYTRGNRDLVYVSCTSREITSASRAASFALTGFILSR